MKKIIFYSLIFVLLQSCQNEENAYSDLWLYYSIGITDMEGNDLLDPTAEKNIVSNKPTLIDIWGNERPSTMYTDNDFLYNQAAGYLVVDRWKVLEKHHYIYPGGPYSFDTDPNHWFDDAKIIIKWGGDIENDTIVFSGGWKEDWGPGITNISINGKELEHSKDIAYYGDYHFIYRKDMSPKK